MTAWAGASKASAGPGHKREKSHALKGRNEFGFEGGLLRPFRAWFVCAFYPGRRYACPGLSYAGLSGLERKERLQREWKRANLCYPPSSAVVHEAGGSARRRGWTWS